jgi:hypothetical protein
MASRPAIASRSCVIVRNPKRRTGGTHLDGVSCVVTLVCIQINVVNPMIDNKPSRIEQKWLSIYIYIIYQSSKIGGLF